MLCNMEYRMKQAFTKTDKFGYLARIALIVVALVLVSFVCFGVFAKYFAQNEYHNTVAASEFYFTVDLLGDTNTEDSLTKTFDLYGGAAHTLPFCVQNFFDDKRINSDAITYTVKIDAESTYDGVSLDQNDASYVFAADAKTSKKFVLSVDAGYKEGDKVVVTVESSAPYQKTMKLVFVMHHYTADVSYRIVDQAGSNAASLIIMTNVEIAKGNLFLDWSNVTTKGGISQNEQNIFQIDTTNIYILDEVDGVLKFDTNAFPAGSYLKQATVTHMLEPGESILIYFFKIDPQADYSISDTPAQKAGDTYQVTIGN